MHDINAPILQVRVRSASVSAYCLALTDLPAARVTSMVYSKVGNKLTSNCVITIKTNKNVLSIFFFGYTFAILSNPNL